MQTAETRVFIHRKFANGKYRIVNTRICVLVCVCVAYPYATIVRDEPNGDICTELSASHILFSDLF